MKNGNPSHNFGLKETDLVFIKNTFQKSGISKLRIFGSRAKGNFRPNSDIDIAYEGEISHNERSKIWSTLTCDAPFLYHVDMVDYKKVAPELQEHIDRVGVEI